MAGRRPLPPEVGRLTGRRPRPRPEDPLAGTRPIKPHWLTGRGSEIWDEIVSFADWLTVADGFFLADWCHAEACYEDLAVRAKLTAADRREHRLLGRELGLAR